MIDVGWFVFSAPEKDADFAPVHENEALALVRYVGAHPATHDAVPSRQIHLVKFCLYNLSNVIEYSSLLESERHAIDSMLLHKLIHVCILDHCVLCFLLVSVPMWLHQLCVSLSFPLLRFSCSRINCCLCDLRRHVLFQFLTTLFNFKFYILPTGFWGFGVLGFWGVCLVSLLLII